MIRTISKAGPPIFRLPQATSLQSFRRLHQLPTPLPFQASSHNSTAAFSSINCDRLRSAAYRTEFRQQTRRCSYRKVMCKRDADTAGGGGGTDVTAYREVLPTNVKPMHYDLTLEPNFDKLTYDGKVVIEYVR